MHNFSYLRVMSMGGHFFPNMNLHGNDLWAVSRLLWLHFLPKYVVAETMGYRKSDLQFSIGCRERGQIFISFCMKHITLICQHDKLPLVRNCFCMKYTQTISLQILSLDYLKNGLYNHLQISSVSLSLSGIDRRSFSVWSLNHDVIQAPFCEFTLSFISP